MQSMQPLEITSRDDCASPSLTISKRRREVVNCKRPRQTHLQCDSLGRCGTHFPFGLWRIRYQSGVVATDYAYIYIFLTRHNCHHHFAFVRLGCWLRAPYQDLLGVISASRSSSHVRSRLLIGRVLVSMLDMASSCPVIIGAMFTTGCTARTDAVCMPSFIRRLSHLKSQRRAKSKTTAKDSILHQLHPHFPGQLSSL